jgi:hypothetical protein
MPVYTTQTFGNYYKILCFYNKLCPNMKDEILYHLEEFFRLELYKPNHVSLIFNLHNVFRDSEVGKHCIYDEFYSNCSNINTVSNVHKILKNAKTVVCPICDFYFVNDYNYYTDVKYSTCPICSSSNIECNNCNKTFITTHHNKNKCDKCLLLHAVTY